MPMILVAALALQSGVKTVTLPREASEEAVVIECPLGRTTRILLPDPINQLRGGGQKDLFSIRVERARPRGVLSVKPSAPGEMLLVVYADQEKTGSLRLRIRVGGDGTVSEVRLIRRPSASNAGSGRAGVGEDVPPAPAGATADKGPPGLAEGHVFNPRRPQETSSRVAAGNPDPPEHGMQGPDGTRASSQAKEMKPSQSPPANPSAESKAANRGADPETEPAGSRAKSKETSALEESASKTEISMAPQPSARLGQSARILDTNGMLAAQMVKIGRREGLPGEPEMVLDVAFKGERWVWLRFFLLGGAKARVERIRWQDAEVLDFVEDAVGADLRVVVQLPRERVTKKTELSIKILQGGNYAFGLSRGTLIDFLKGLF